MRDGLLFIFLFLKQFLQFGEDGCREKYLCDTIGIKKVSEKIQQKEGKKCSHGSLF